MSKIIVSNRTQVYKSLAVILPTVIVAVAGALGWVIKQPNMEKGG